MGILRVLLYVDFTIKSIQPYLKCVKSKEAMAIVGNCKLAKSRLKL